MNIKGNLVTLRGIEESDLEYLREIINDAFMEEMETGFNFPISIVQQKKWFESLWNHSPEGRFIIETNSNKQSVGYIALIHFDWKNRSAHMGIKLYGEGSTSKGYATDAVMALMRYFFEEMNLHRMEGYFLDYNENCRKLCIHNCGWKEEGVKRKAVFKRNAYHDLHIMGILKSEYQELIRKNHYWGE